MRKKTTIQQRFLFFFITCTLLVSSLAYGQNEPYVVKSTVSPCVNVRTDHSTDAPSIACLVPGTPVTVVGSVPFWREILFGNSQRGWIAKKYIEPATPHEEEIVNAIPSNAFLTIHYVDVGQGDAIWIQTYDDGIDGNGKFEGYSIVIDGGPYSADNSNPFLPYIKNEAYRNADIEALFISHPHADHFNGAASISKNFHINHYYDPGYPSTISSYVSFKNAMKGTRTVPGRASHVHIGKANFGPINWGSELQAEVLYAWDGDVANTLGSGNTEVNNSSIVLRVQYGEHVFLFMGDAEGKERDDDPAIARFVEKVLLETVPDKLKTTVLKIAHHGSETSSTLPFIQAVNPDIVIVQSGRKSFSGTYLPDLSTLQRYCDHNPHIRIYRTDEGDEEAGLSTSAAVDGDNIVITSNGTGQPQVRALQGGVPFNGKFCRE
ncbi:MAG: MBL fold metallo-hydrolase [Bacteroidota bacterium]|nr:MBL fold metallo-hydrolase [Bacteroidota bacterium]